MKEIISIIVPVYNIKSDLPKCLDSILAQTYSDLEVILVDDGSTDGSGAVVEEYARRDARVVVLHQENGGVTRARFAGIRRATGSWIGFVDGDDYIEPDMYRHLLDNARKYQADISHCGYQMVFHNRVVYYHNTGCLVQQDKPTGQYDLLAGSRIEPGLWNKLFHKTLFHSLLHSGVEELGVKINEDLLMNFYLFREARSSVYEDFCPYHYIVRAGSAANTRNVLHHRTDPQRVRKILCQETRDDPLLYPAALRLYVRTLLSNAMQGEFPELRQSTRAELRRLCRDGAHKRLPRRERAMMLLSVWCPGLYRLVRTTYDRLRGIDHIYDLE